MVGGNAAVLFVVYRSVCLAADSLFLSKWQRNKIDQICSFAAPVTRSRCRKTPWWTSVSEHEKQRFKTKQAMLDRNVGQRNKVSIV